MNKPPAFEGPIRTMDDVRAYLEHEYWVRQRVRESMALLKGSKFKPMRSYANGKLAAVYDILERLNWPDACEKCGAQPVVSTGMDGKAQCQRCDDLELDAMIDEEGGEE